MTGIGAQYTEAPSQEARHEIRSREINQTSNVKNLDSCTNHQHSFVFGSTPVFGRGGCPEWHDSGLAARKELAVFEVGDNEVVRKKGCLGSQESPLIQHG